MLPINYCVSDIASQHMHNPHLPIPPSLPLFAGRGDVSQALAAVFASAARDAGGCGGLSHRERLQAGIRDLQAQWYGPLVP